MDEKTRILIVDDEPINLDFFEVMLGKLGFEVYRAEDGEEALKRVKECNPDLIMLDNIMPKLSGWKVTRILKTHESYAAYKDVPIIMFSALDDVKDKIEGFELGVEDYIVKPFNFSEVLARIRAALRNGELRKHVLQREKRLSTSCTMNESLVEFVEGIPPSLRALRNAAQSLDVKDEEAVSAFTEDVIAETERLIAEAESLSGDAKALRQESASIKEEAHHLEEIDARFQKRFEQAKNDLKDFDGVKK
ncbi:MAG TPA: response regulator [Spirochaetia bacterium]|nr:response regulator [Spirochaetia bacterium]